MRRAINRLLLIMLLFSTNTIFAGALRGRILSQEKGIELANVYLKNEDFHAVSDENGYFSINAIPEGTYQILVSALGFESKEITIDFAENDSTELSIELKKLSTELNEVVVSGTMKEVSKLESPVPVEVYTAKFFKANPTPSIFDALQQVNGVRPQINCNVCNTGDIHINGMEGPYTMVLIDGMPIVSGLSSVYGLSGIPQALIDRVEIVKGPASTLYGSEAVGGLINIITKNPKNAEKVATDFFATSWGEIQADLSGTFDIGSQTKTILGINYFNYSNPIDNNKDGFTDVTLQNRFSVFNKWHFKRKENKLFSLAARYVYEDRWGGDMRWNRSYRGGDSIYGESIYTKRWEVFGAYQLPVKEPIFFRFSSNHHDQNSAYGNSIYKARQFINFVQLTWHKKVGKHDFVIGSTFRHTFYDDNTPATATFDSANGNKNRTTNMLLPGLFAQNEWQFNKLNTLLLGLRYDYNSIHGNIFSPRLNYKWRSQNSNNVLRLGIGNGYRVANVFTEDHAALTGARELVFISDLKPETSWNANLNFVKKIFMANGFFLGIDASAFYSYFSNKIIADYDSDPNKIIYNNLAGYAVSKGASLNLDLNLNNGFKVLLGGTFMDVYSRENNEKIWQTFSEKFSGVWTVSYSFHKIGLSLDYTGNIYSPMRLPLLSALDPRSEFSPWWSIQNIQVTKKIGKSLEAYAGVKNFLNWTPNRGNPFIIARSNDPFDKSVQFDADGNAIATAQNPYGLTFDPTYVYAPNQGARVFAGFRFSIR